MIVCVRTVLKNGVFSISVSTLICCRAERREFGGIRVKLLGLRLKILQPLNVGRLFGFVECGQSPVDEVQAAGLTCAGAAVGGDDLVRHGLDLRGLSIRKDGKLRRLASLARIFLSGKYVMVVGRDPCRVQPPYGIYEERSS